MESRRRIAISIVLVALVAVAGCTSGPSGDSSGTDSPATNGTTATTTTTKTLDDLSFPDGATDEGVENGSALAATHVERLSDTGYEVEVTASYSAESESGTSTYVVRRDAETGEMYQRTARKSNGDERGEFAYANDTATYTKRGTDDPSWDVNTRRTSDDVADNNVVMAAESILPMGNWTDPSVVSADGQPFVEYELDGIAPEPELIDADTVTNASGTLLVDQQGVVHRLTLTIAQERDGTESQTNYEYHVKKTGDVTVEQPDWVSTAIEETETEEETTDSSRVQIVSGFGSVSDGTVETVNLTVMRAPGADDINLSMATVEWVGPNAATTLTVGDSMTEDTFVVEPIKDEDGSAPVLNEHDDRFMIAMDASAVGGALEEGESVELKVTTQYGTVTYYRANVPEDLSDETAVTL
ncbi:DUF7537 family lipoprotein [Halomicrococcus gelatinilyticus]|uniref:DUF7537 family lipoprotein n=1 Tax=Halomicrococcus gelatinilyticus TaxID=1702103 RepID=UPI002E0D1E1E